MAPINEHDRVVLTTDVVEAGLAAGDVGVVIHVHGKGDAYEVEFVTLDGETHAILTLEGKIIRPVGQHEMPHARRVA